MYHSCSSGWNFESEKDIFLSEFETKIQAIIFSMRLTKPEKEEDFLETFTEVMDAVLILFNNIFMPEQFSSTGQRSTLFQLYAAKREYYEKKSILHIHIGGVDFDENFPVAKMEIEFERLENREYLMYLERIQTAPFVQRLGFASVLTIQAMTMFYVLWNLTGGNVKFQVFAATSVSKRMFSQIFRKLGYSNERDTLCQLFITDTKLNTARMQTLLYHCAEKLWKWHEENTNKLQLPFAGQMQKLQEHIQALENENAQIQSSNDLLHMQNEQLREQMLLALQMQRENRSIRG